MNDTNTADGLQELRVIADKLTELVSVFTQAELFTQATNQPPAELPKVNGRSPQADAIYLSLVDKTCRDFGHAISSQLVDTSSPHLTYWKASAKETFYKWLVAVPYHASNAAKIGTVQYSLRQALRDGLVRTVADHSREVAERAIERAIEKLPSWRVLMAQAIGQVVMGPDPSVPEQVD